MSNLKKTNHEDGDARPAEDEKVRHCDPSVCSFVDVTNVDKGTKTQDDAITINEMVMAQDIFKKDLVEALAQQKSSGSNAEIEARIAKLKNELDTLDREIKATRQ